MRILGVRFKNLNSLKGEFEIRFDRGALAESGLFAITGPTGAGKTTLLDAITVALYNRVPRHDRNVEELMSRHTGECWSEVEFESGSTRYRSKWSLRRAHGRANGKLQSDDMELSRVDTGEILTGHKKKETLDLVEKVTGLDYEQFLRSVLLAQGEFTRFLKASANERSQLLEQMTDTDIFSRISRFVYAKHVEEKQKLETLNQVLGNITSLSEAEVEAKVKAKGEIEAEVAVKEAEESEIRKLLEWWKEKAEGEENRQRLEEQGKALAAEMEQAAPMLQKLTLHEQAWPHHALVESITADTRKLLQWQEESTILSQSLQKWDAELNRCRVAHEAAAKALASALEDSKRQYPVIEQVTAMDKEIARLEAEAKQKHEEAVEAGKKLLQLQQRQGELLEDKQNLEQDLLRLKPWLESNQHWQTLAEKESEWLDTISQWQYQLQETASIAAATAEAESRIAGQQEQWNQSNAEQEKLQLEIKRIAQQMEDLKPAMRNLMAEQDAATMRSRLDELPEVLATGGVLLNLSGEYRQLLEEQAGLQNAIIDSEKAMQAVTEKGRERRALLEEAEAHSAALKTLYDQQVLVLKYEADRHQLIHGEPCPLCGALEHPFAQHAPAQSLQEAQAKCDQQQEKIAGLQQEVTDLREQFLILKQQWEGYSERLKEKAAQAAGKKELFDRKNTFSSGVLNIADKIAIDLWLKNTQELQRQLATQWQQYQALQEEELSLAQQHQGLELRLSTAWQQKQFAESGREKALKDREALQKSYGDALSKGEMLDEKIAALLAPFAINWTTRDAAGAKASWQAMKTEYQERQQRSLALENALALADKDIANQQALADSVKQQWDKLQGEARKLDAMVAEGRNARIELFGEKDPLQEKDRLQRAEEAARSAEKQAGDALQEALKQQLAVERDTQNMDKQIIQLQEQLTQTRLKLEGLALAAGFAQTEALVAALLAPEEAAHLKQLAHALHNRETQLKTLTDQNRQSLEKLAERGTPAQDQDTLQLALGHLLSTVAGLNQKLGSLTSELEADALRKKQYAEKLAEKQMQQQAVSRWKQLTDLIGSADGNKFRMFVQGLTLQQLATLANRHLRHFSPRYSIAKMPGDNLELEIHDAWQADVARPISTLSGGETFLVSLSLALGLSDLASRKVQIGSLFIDEGFGTLDADTLDTAMDALENLQMQGRTIGIISHVGALKERMRTQVQVHKRPGGNSTVEVNGVSAEI